MLVGKAHHQAVLRRVVLVAVLADEAFACTVVRLAFAAATILHLVPLKVRLVLDDLDERHGVASLNNQERPAARVKR